jgi:DNA-binding CsgD family transcriptional regulator
MVDFTNQRYLPMGQGVYNMMGYSPEDIYREGLRMAFQTTHPDDLVLLKELHQKLFAIYYETPIQRRKDLKFAFNLRVKKADGEYIRILQQTIFPGISDTGEPLFDFSTVTDITEFVKDNDLTLTVSELDDKGLYEQRYTQHFLHGHSKFTPRQQQIIDLIGKGYTTRAIAEALYISVDTVKNHRKKILQLAGSKKIVEVVRAQR